MRSVLNRCWVIALLISVVFLTSLTFAILKSWFKELQVYSDPTIERVVNWISELPNEAWAQWVFFFAVGFLAARTADVCIRRMQADENRERIQLGMDMRSMGERVWRNIEDPSNRPPNQLGIPSGELSSLFVRIRRANIWLPDFRIYENAGGPKFLANHLVTIGTLLRDGDFSEATKNANAARDAYERGIGSETELE